MKKLIIFDLDGTLLNTIADLGTACNHALAQCGFPEHPIADYPLLVGNGINKLIERALPTGSKTEADIQRMRPLFVDYYNTHNCIYTRPYAGVESLLATLHAEDWLLAVASNKYQAATAHLVDTYFPNMFNCVLGEREGCPRKPDPQIVDDILAMLQVDKEKDHVLYVGDSDVDMLTAQHAGLPAIACCWGFCPKEKLQEYQPAHIVSSAEEILGIV